MTQVTVQVSAAVKAVDALIEAAKDLGNEGQLSGLTAEEEQAVRDARAEVLKYLAPTNLSPALKLQHGTAYGAVCFGDAA